jgi:outer membrane receptor protein involved in Fe transport
MEDHLVTAGLETWKSVLGQVKYDANYLTVADGKVVDKWMTPSNRWFLGLFLQDQWSIGERLTVVSGVRFDHYDDVDDSLSPNITVKYDWDHGFITRFQYGHSFRAPSFRELHKRPAGARIIGNPDLEPEEADTVQVQFEWQAGQGLVLEATGYYIDLDNAVTTVFNERARAFEFTNLGHCYSKGIDLTASFMSSTAYFDYEVFASLSYVNSKSNAREVPGIAHWTGRWGASVEFLDYYSAALTFFYVGQQAMERGDSRGDVPEYVIADLGLRVRDFGGLVKGVDAGVSVQNLFDTDYAYAELSGRLPDNMQRPGIDVQGWLRYSF